MGLILFILCSDINKTNYDETLLLAILSKFKLTSLRVLNLNWNKDECEDILMTLLQIPSIQETLEHFTIDFLDNSKYTSVFELLVEFKRIKRIKIGICYSKDDKFEELKKEIKQFEKKLRKKHSENEIYIDYVKRKMIKINFFG